MNQFDKLSLSSGDFQPYFEFWESRYPEFGQGFQLGQRPALTAADNPMSLQELPMPKEAAEKMLALGGGQDTAVFVCFVTALGLLMKKYQDCQQFILASPLIGLSAEGGASYASEVPLLLSFEEGSNLKSVLHSVQEGIRECYQFQNYPLEVLAKRPGEKPFATNIFLNYQALHGAFIPATAHDLCLDLQRQDASFSVGYRFNEAVFSQEFVAAFHERLGYLLNQLDSLEKPIRELEIWSAEEQQKVRLSFNDTQQAFAGMPQALPALFEAQARLRPEALALVYEDRSWTYGTLNAAADKLAFALKNDYQLQTNDLVGLMIERSDWSIISILAVWKAGAAYVPVDPAYPRQRIRQLLDDASPKLLITHSTHLFEFGYYEGQLFTLDLQFDLLPDPEDDLPPVSPEDLAYVIYTSGSTGQPKGVAVTHQSIANTLMWRKNYYGFGPEDACLQLFPIVFDGSLTDSFSALISGGSLILPTESGRTHLPTLKGLIERYTITHFIIIPSQYSVLLAEIGRSLKGMKAISLAGEAASQELVAAHYKQLPGVQLFNEYGPTEHAVCATATLLTADQPVTIGQPIANTHAYIVDQDLRLQAPGIPGEIALSGRGTAQRYLGDAALTAKKFVNNPFDDGYERLYLTGDLGTWTAEGAIIFHGRKDQQLKIRGYRIEREEIRQALLSAADVQEAVIEARTEPGGASHLFAYVTGNVQLDAEKLKAHLAQLLPVYMLPSRVLVLDSFPRNASGKIDRKALPDYIEEASLRPAYLPPVTEAEKELARHWELMLGKEKVGKMDNYFDLGGDSIKAIQIAARMHVAGYKIEVKDIFNAPRLEDLGRLAESLMSKSLLDEPQAPSSLESLGEEELATINELLK